MRASTLLHQLWAAKAERADAADTLEWCDSKLTEHRKRTHRVITESGPIASFRDGKPCVVFTGQQLKTLAGQYAATDVVAVNIKSDMDVTLDEPLRPGDEVTFADGMVRVLEAAEGGVA